MEIRVLVSRLLEEPGEIDPRARSVHEVLRRELRYGSLELVLSRELRLALDEVGEVRLPNDKRLRVRPLLIDDRGALVAVGVQGSIQTDLRVQSGQLVVIGTERSDRGKLAIALEPRFETPASGPP